MLNYCNIMSQGQCRVPQQVLIMNIIKKSIVLNFK
jgi:hypothetical protein